jgi:valyl-tRNA synthetase
MGDRPYDLIVARWPEPQAQRDPHAEREINELVALIDAVRTARAEYDLPWSETLGLQFADKDEAFRTRIFGHAKTVQRIAKTSLHDVPSEPANSAHASDGKGIHLDAAAHAFYLLVPDSVDLDAQRARLAKAIGAAEKDRDSLAARLANPAFAERAKPEAVEKARADHAEKSAEAERLRAALDRLG